METRDRTRLSCANIRVWSNIWGPVSGLNRIHLRTTYPDLTTSAILITMQCYTVLSANANFYHQPHRLVQCNQFKTISALAEEVRVLSTLSASSSFPSWSFGGIVQLEASGQVLDQDLVCPGMGLCLSTITFS